MEYLICILISFIIIILIVLIKTIKKYNSTDINILNNLISSSVDAVENLSINDINEISEEEKHDMIIKIFITLCEELNYKKFINIDNTVIEFLIQSAKLKYQK